MENYNKIVRLHLKLFGRTKTREVLMKAAEEIEAAHEKGMGDISPTLLTVLKTLPIGHEVKIAAVIEIVAAVGLTPNEDVIEASLTE